MSDDTARMFLLGTIGLVLLCVAAVMETKGKDSVGYGVVGLFMLLIMLSYT